MSCRNTTEDKYVEVFYNHAPGAKLPMTLYCKCELTDTPKKQFENYFTISGDSLVAFLKHYEKLQPSDSKDSINAAVFILFHNSETTDTICAGYDGRLKMNSRYIKKNPEFTREVMALVAQHHSQIMANKFRKQP